MKNSVRSGKAYALFVAELEKYLDLARGMIGKSCQLSESELFRLSAAFHTIKGGSGFFGLTELAMLSGQLETLFNDLDRSPEEKLKQAGPLFSEFEKLCAAVPEPLPET